MDTSGPLPLPEVNFIANPWVTRVPDTEISFHGIVAFYISHVAVDLQLPRSTWGEL